MAVGNQASKAMTKDAGGKKAVTGKVVGSKSASKAPSKGKTGTSSKKEAEDRAADMLEKVGILNDNEWSIAKNVGAIASYLNKLITHDIKIRQIQFK